MVEERITKKSLAERETASECKIAIGTIASAGVGFGLGKLLGMAFDLDLDITPLVAAGIGGFFGGALVATIKKPMVSWDEISSLYGRVDNLAHTQGVTLSERDQYFDKLEFTREELVATGKARDGALRSLERITDERKQETQRADRAADNRRKIAGLYNAARERLDLADTANALNFFARGRSYQTDLRESTPTTIQDNLFTLVAEEDIGQADKCSSGLFITSNGYGIATARQLEGIGEGRSLKVIDSDSVEYGIDPDSVLWDSAHNLALFRTSKKDNNPLATPIYVENRLRSPIGEDITAYHLNEGIHSQKGALTHERVDIKNQEGVRGVAVTNLDYHDGLMGAPVLDANNGLAGFVSYTGRGDDTRVAFTPINYANNLIVREVSRLSSLIESRE